jgi:hypothetical protein
MREQLIYAKPEVALLGEATYVIQGAKFSPGYLDGGYVEHPESYEVDD